jgi:hypothetical protein
MLKKTPEPIVHSSLGLGAICQRLQDAATCEILELGTVKGDNVQFWSRFSPFLHIADLRSILPLPVVPEDPEVLEQPERDWDHLLPLPESRQFDLILAWDLLNYLEIPDVSSLIRYLSRFCRPGTLLFTLIFDLKEMPKEICAYRIVDGERLRYEYGSAALRTCPRHQPRTIASAMPQFRVANSFRLRNGVVEYIFSYGGD